MNKVAKLTTLLISTFMLCSAYAQTENLMQEEQRAHQNNPSMQDNQLEQEKHLNKLELYKMREEHPKLSDRELETLIKLKKQHPELKDSDLEEFNREFNRAKTEMKQTHPDISDAEMEKRMKRTREGLAERMGRD